MGNLEIGQYRDNERMIRQELLNRKEFRGHNGIVSSTLSQEITLLNTTRQVEFTFEKNNAAVRRYEALLSQNDSFVATGLGIYLARVDTTQEGGHALHTHPAVDVFPEHVGLEAIYRGWLKIEAEQRVITENFGLQKFRAVPQTQQLAALGAGVAKSQYSFGQGLFLPTPYLILYGDLQNKLTISIPFWNGQVIESAAAGFENRLVMQLEGYIVYNVKFGSAQNVVR